MKRECPVNHCLDPKIIRKGYFPRISDSKKVPRYKCKTCGANFSQATFSKYYRQHRRRLNPSIYKLLSSGVSQRRISRLLSCNLKTVARKLRFLGSLHDFKKEVGFDSVTEVQFDEMETWIHSKLKPASILVVVEKDSRKILALKASHMPAKGLIKERSIKKYGKIKDERPGMFKEVFSDLQQKLSPYVQLESDECPRYPRWVKKYFPNSHYKRHKGLRGCVVGQGELKGGGFDPLFSLNHTCAMIRANVNRLFRRTWCTSKDIHCLQMHLNLYAHYHNSILV